MGAAPEDLEEVFPDSASANKAFQKIETRLSRKLSEGIKNYLKNGSRPEGAILKEKLSVALCDFGFSEVETPLIVSKKLLERMGLDDESALTKQIFWLDANRAIRPMLAPNLYYLLVDLLRIAPHPVSIFEIGPCMRKESQGARHGEEFTMLNIVEMGLKMEDRMARTLALARLVLETIGIPFESCKVEEESSTVYSTTLDIVSPQGLELASTAMGPHPLDAPWRIDVPWVGLGFGIERLLMALKAQKGETVNLAKVSRSLSYLGGFRLNIS
jgi:phenylalanyl-tRNA synthetase alpha chain